MYKLKDFVLSEDDLCEKEDDGEFYTIQLRKPWSKYIQDSKCYDIVSLCIYILQDFSKAYVSMEEKSYMCLEDEIETTNVEWEPTTEDITIIKKYVTLV